MAQMTVCGASAARRSGLHAVRQAAGSARIRLKRGAARCLFAARRGEMKIKRIEERAGQVGGREGEGCRGAMARDFRYVWRLAFGFIYGICLCWFWGDAMRL
eukprot:scaffold8400_cov116-Isochrysis_galbana.AAC.4